MLKRSIAWRTHLIAGAIVNISAGLFLHTLPIAREYIEISMILAMVIFGGIIRLVWRWEIKDENLPKATWPVRMAFKPLLWFFGAAASWVLVWGPGYLKLSSIYSNIRSSGTFPDYPKNDILDYSKRNGMTLLDRLADGRRLKILFDGNSKIKGDRGINSDILSVRKNSLVDDVESSLALERLRKRRSEWKFILNAVDGAQKAPVFSWNIIYDVPLLEVKIPRFSHYLNISRVLFTESMLQLVNGDYDEAERILLQGFWLSSQVNRNSSLVAAMVAAAMDGILMDGVLPLSRIGRGGVIIKELEKRNPRKSVEFGLRNEFFHTPSGVLEMMRTNAIKACNGTLTEGTLVLRTYMAIGYVAGESWSPWVASTAFKNALILDECLKNQPLVALQCYDENIARVSKSKWKILSITLPKFGEMYFKGVIALAKQRMVQSSYAAQKFRKEKGRWPKGLEELAMGEAALDPVTNKVFITRNTRTGFEICFFGKNMVEDSPKESEDQLDKDIIFRL